MIFLYYFWMTLMTLSIASQLPHALWSIENNSKIKVKWERVAQKWAFCLIISGGVLGFVLEGLHWYALAGSVIDIIINVNYYNGRQPHTSFVKKLKKDSFLYFLAVLIPMSIFVFSLMMAESKKRLELKEQQIENLNK